MLREKRGESVISNNFRPYTQETWDKYSKEKKTFAIYMGLYEGMRGQEEEFKEKLKNYEDLLKAKDIRINELEGTVERLQSSLTIFVTPETHKLEVLRLYAKGNSALNIHRIMNDMKKMDIEYEVISDIIQNLKNGDLSSEDIEFYQKEVKVFIENSANYEEEYRMMELRRILENQASIDSIIAKAKTQGLDEETMAQTSMLIQLMKEQRENVKALSNIMKGTTNSNVGNNIENTSKEVANKTQEENLNILKEFDPTKLVTVH